MKNIAPQLHIILGSISSMLIAFLALINGTSPSTCLMKAAAAFLVFAGFGLILRFALTEALAAEENRADNPSANGYSNPSGGMHSLDMIVPGTSVADLLASQPSGKPTGETDGNEIEEDDRAAA